MNLPNKLTMLRVILVPVFMVFAAYSRYGTADFNPTFALIAGIIFAVASFTDFLDGYLARKNNLVTDFGKFMDPLADKCLTTAAFIYMVACGICSPVVLAVILFRYAQYKGMDTVTLEENLTGFADADEISGYAVSALNWAVGAGVLKGTGTGLAPKANATRSEVAQMLMNFDQNVAK